MNPAIESQDECALKRPPPKFCRVLTALLEAPLDTFRAERDPIYDHCLPSTISELRHRGLEIYSERVQRVGYAGVVVSIAQYTLAPESRQRALQMILGAQ